MRELCREALDAAIGAGAAVRGRARRAPAPPVGRHEERAASTRSTTPRARGSACACSSAAPGASPATGDSTRDGRPRRGRCARARSRAPRRRAASARSRRSTARSGALPDAASSATRSRFRSADKVELCLRAEAALAHADVIVTAASRARAARAQGPAHLRRARTIEQELVEMRRRHRRDRRRATASSSCAATRARTVGSSAQAGWEYVEALGLEREAPRVGEQAAALLRADACPPRRHDGRHRRRADGARRCTSRSATRSSSTASTGPRPPTRARASCKPDDLGSLRYGSPLMNITADATTPRRPRHVRVRRRGRAGARASRSSSRASCAASSPRARRRRGSAPAAAARCAPTAGAGCRSCG